jgi:hypothetical protein
MRVFYCNYRWREASTQIRFHSEVPRLEDSAEGKFHSEVSNWWGGFDPGESFILKSQITAVGGGGGSA